ncbi:MAG TPA: DUF6702 family protein [Phnomibacter sp.]|nr:DUF6702 family protein [Phnomibacter sp.]
MYLFLIHFFFTLLHPFFVSVTDVHHNAKTRSLEISIRIFTDDFENTLRMHHPGKKIDLMEPPAGSAMDSLIRNYLQEKMSFQINGRSLPMQYIGFEREGESIWTYFEINGITELKKLKIHNSVLYEYKKEQINMVHVTVGKDRQSRKLDNPMADWEFSF